MKMERVLPLLLLPSAAHAGGGGGGILVVIIFLPLMIWAFIKVWGSGFGCSLLARRSAVLSRERRRQRQGIQSGRRRGVSS